MELTELPGPGLRELYFVFTSATVPPPLIKKEQFDNLAKTLAEVDGSGGWHAVGWYLHWLLNTCNEDSRILTCFNKLFSTVYVNKFKLSVPVGVCVCYESLLSNPKAVDRLDTYPVLRYALKLRLNSADARPYLAQNLNRIFQDYLGLPFVRTALSSTAETSLWNHVVSRCASYIRR
jgi:hypothetical protein